MSMATIGAILTLIVFVAVLATPKLPNWFCFLIMAPIVVFTGTMDADGVYAVLSSSSFHLMAIICMFSGMIAATGLDIVMGNALDKLTGNVSGKKKEMLIIINSLSCIRTGIICSAEQLCCNGIFAGDFQYS